MKQINGDLVKKALMGEFDVIVHGCNTRRTMGKGIALQIKNTFPEAFQADQNFYIRDSEDFPVLKLGCFSWAKSKGVIVVNAYTQDTFWSHGDPEDKVYVDYEAVRLCFKKLKAMFGGKGHKIGIPLIGAGLAHGDWGVIRRIVDEEMEGEDLTVVLYKEEK